MTRDHQDVITADVVLVNLLGACQRVTIGTVMEIAWAWDRQIPVVVMIEKQANVHDHPMIREAIGFRVDNLDDGIACVRSLLCHQ